jgi:3-oxoacyl-[acyl-carrier-protein] synthase-3
MGEVVLTREATVRALGLTSAQLAQPHVQRALAAAPELRRRTLEPGVSTSTLLVRAGQAALRDAGLRPEDLGLVICATDIPDYILPSTAARVQHELGATRAGFFDVGCVCAGFTIALAVARGLMEQDDELRYVLVLGGNVYSRAFEPSDLFGQLVFSDGAAGVILAASPEHEHGLEKFAMVGEGRYWAHWGIFGGGTWKGTSEQTLAEGWHKAKVLQEYEKDFNHEKWPPVIREVLRKTGWSAADIDLAFVTQSRPGPIAHMCQQFGWEPHVAYPTADRYGYIGTGCIPLALDDARQRGVLSAGQRLLVLTSGAGYACSAMTMSWGSP